MKTTFRLLFAFFILHSAFRVAAQTPIRLQADSSIRYTVPVDLNNGGQGVSFFNGDNVAFEFGLERSGVFQGNLSAYTNFVLQIFRSQSDTNSPVMAEALTNVNNATYTNAAGAVWNTGCTGTLWTNNASGPDTNFSVGFAFTASQTAFLPSTASSGSYWLRLFSNDSNNPVHVTTWLEGPVTVLQGPVSALYVAPAWPLGVLVNPDDTLDNPTNFFVANSNLLNQAVSGGGGGGATAFNSGQFLSSSSETNIAPGASVTNLVLQGNSTIGPGTVTNGGAGTSGGPTNVGTNTWVAGSRQTNNGIILGTGTNTQNKYTANLVNILGSANVPSLTVSQSDSHADAYGISLDQVNAATGEGFHIDGNGWADLEAFRNADYSIYNFEINGDGAIQNTGIFQQSAYIFPSGAATFDVAPMNFTMASNTQFTTFVNCSNGNVLVEFPFIQGAGYVNTAISATNMGWVYRQGGILGNSNTMRFVVHRVDTIDANTLTLVTVNHDHWGIGASTNLLVPPGMTVMFDSDGTNVWYDLTAPVSGGAVADSVEEYLGGGLTVKTNAPTISGANITGLPAADVSSPPWMPQTNGVSYQQSATNLAATALGQDAAITVLGSVHASTNVNTQNLNVSNAVTMEGSAALTISAPNGLNLNNPGGPITSDGLFGATNSDTTFPFFVTNSGGIIEITGTNLTYIGTNGTKFSWDGMSLNMTNGSSFWRFGTNGGWTNSGNAQIGGTGYISGSSILSTASGLTGGNFTRANGTSKVEDSGIKYTNYTVAVDNTSAVSITNTATGRAFWVLTLKFTDASTGTACCNIRRTELFTNGPITHAPGAVASVTTNLYVLPVAGNTTNFMDDVSSGSGASVTVIDSHIEQ